MRQGSGLFIFLATGVIFLTVACNLTAPGSSSSSNVGTAVAATITALTPVSTANTLDAHVIATANVPSVTPVRVVFVDSARNLYVWTDGTAAPIEIVNSGDVDQSFVSSDGSLIVYTRTNDYSTYEMDVANSDGTNQRVLMNSAAFAALPHPSGSTGIKPYKLSWVANSHRLGMSLQLLFEGPGLQTSDTLYTVDADTGVVSPLVTPGQNFNFSFSPNGSWLVVTLPTGISLYTAAGTSVAANVVTHEFVNTASEYAWVAKPYWQSNSSNFMVAIPPKEPWADSPAVSNTWKVTVTGLATNTFSGEMSFGQDGMASFDPSLSRMAFATRLGTPADNTWSLHVANVDGTVDSVVDTGYFSMLPVWSPDGNSYVFSKLVGSNKQAYLVVDGSTPALVGDISSLLDIRWLDNSQYVVSSRTATGASLLLETIGATGGVIFNDPGWNDQQGFSFNVNR